MRSASLFRAATVVAGVAAATAVGAVIYTVRQVQGRAAGDVREFLCAPHPHARPVVVLGASIVRGRASVDFVQMLRDREPSRDFVNAGVNGNVAWEVLQRLDSVIDCAPSRVVILVGTNDVQATLSPEAGQSAQESKGLPQVPSLQWYAACLDDIVGELHQHGAKVALCSLPPIGQDLAAPVNQRVREFNSSIEMVAEDSGATYLPVYERLTELLTAEQMTEGPAWTGAWWPGVDSLLRHFILGTSFDVIAASRGWLLSPDGVHMDTLGAATIADVIEAWIAGQDTGA